MINSSSKSSKRVSGDEKTGELSDKGELNEIDAIHILDSNVIEVNCNKQPIIHDQLHTEGGMKDGQVKDAVIDACDIPEIELEDIQEEISFWESSIVCYILGANPPLMVIEGFIRRIWGKFGIDKVASLDRGFFIVRCHNVENRDAILNEGYQFFDGNCSSMEIEYGFEH